VKQIKALVIIVDFHVIVSTCTRVNRVSRRKEGGTREHEGEESVTARGKFEGHNPLNPNVSYLLPYLLT